MGQPSPFQPPTAGVYSRYVAYDANTNSAVPPPYVVTSQQTPQLQQNLVIPMTATIPAYTPQPQSFSTQPPPPYFYQQQRSQTHQPNTIVEPTFDKALQPQQPPGQKAAPTSSQNSNATTTGATTSRLLGHKALAVGDDILGGNNEIAHALGHSSEVEIITSNSSSVL